MLAKQFNHGERALVRPDREPNSSFQSAGRRIERSWKAHSLNDIISADRQVLQTCPAVPSFNRRDFDWVSRLNLSAGNRIFMTPGEDRRQQNLIFIDVPICSPCATEPLAEKARQFRRRGLRLDKSFQDFD